MISSGPESHNSQQTTEAGQIQGSLQLVLDDIKKSLEEISTASVVYSDCAEKLREQPSPFPTFEEDIKRLSKDINEQERHQKDVFNRTINGLHHDISKQVELALGDTLLDVIREETAKIVQKEVDEHIKDHLPVTLKEQAEQSTEQLQKIKISLKNSHARRQNAFVDRMELDRPLEPVLKSTGEKSPHYPPTMKRLFEYDLEKAKALSEDYGLTADDDVETNFQNFLRHIGTSVDVISSDVLDAIMIDPEDLDNQIGDNPET